MIKSYLKGAGFPLGFGLMKTNSYDSNDDRRPPSTENFIKGALDSGIVN